ncbi:hypothetical protein ACFX2J_007382 [Malus domestica]
MTKWCDLSTDILHIVAERLSYVDFVRFGAVCKSWQAVKDGVQQRTVHPPLTSYYCCSQNNGETLTVARLFGLSAKERFSITNVIHSSLPDKFTHLCAWKYGWLLLAKFEPKATTFLFYSPFRNELIELTSISFPHEKRYFGSDLHYGSNLS